MMIDIAQLHGTPRFVSPEQITLERGMRSSKPPATSFRVDPAKCDVFSLGILFLELLGIDNVKKFLNINKKDEQLTKEFIV